MATDDKRLIRREVRERLAHIPCEEKPRRAQVIIEGIKSHLAVCGARVVALFSPLADEPQIASLIDELAKEMLVVLPRIDGDVMEFFCYSRECMVTGAYGIMEPCGTEPVQPYEIDAVIVPGVAFTVNGWRMGRGKGYYDKYLSRKDFRALKIGVCYAEQIVPSLPLEPHDVVMDCVISA